MAKAYKFRITAYKAQKWEGGVTIEMAILERPPAEEVVELEFNAAKERFAAFAAEQTEPRACTIQCLSPRNPPGFKDFGRMIYVNV